VVEASEDSHQDLFWALRGGNAGSFGVVSQYKIRVHKTPVYTMFSINYDPKVFKELMMIWMDSFPQMDSRMSSQFMFFSNTM